MQVCSMCKQEAELQSSHAIPDAFFRKILKKQSGKYIVVPGGGNSPIHYSSDSWDTHQLCSPCEIHLNKNYETYAIKLLRGSACKVVKHIHGVTFSGVESHILVGFFISIFWRAANSEHPNYSKVIIPEPWNTEFRELLLAKNNIPLRLATIRLSRLIDRTKNDGFTLDSLKNIVMTPFFRKGVSHKYSFCFVFEGFFIEIFIPGLSLAKRKLPGVLNNKIKIIFVPFLDIFDVPEIVEVLVEGYSKFVDGDVTFKN
ncbi:hypothetical protein [Shewanella morhuae]|uniref:HNH endonuclease 5 domain-containing protein n=1 Tax=Shewanella morhuae TaxID=365591 RepID=A0A379ZDA1_9GAMM|nr:hypothetical protein [Shewanella morhuae]SUI59787.1 Uncharacterised protein [Shewanella morhuae]